MANGIVLPTEPSPEQFLPRRGRRRSWGKGIVWNPKRQLLEIRKRVDIEKDPAAYMSCPLPSQSNCVNIFLDSETESEAFVDDDCTGDNIDKVFIGRLNLQRLGFLNQLLRFCGNLSTLYIVKQSPVGTPLAEEQAK